MVLHRPVGLVPQGSLLDLLLPKTRLSGVLSQFLGGVNFHETLLNGMLSFLLFAGALHVDWREMHRGRWPILFRGETTDMNPGGFVRNTLLNLMYERCERILYMGESARRHYVAHGVEADGGGSGTRQSALCERRSR